MCLRWMCGLNGFVDKPNQNLNGAKLASISKHNVLKMTANIDLHSDSGGSWEFIAIKHITTLTFTFTNYNCFFAKQDRFNHFWINMDIITEINSSVKHAVENIREAYADQCYCATQILGSHLSILCLGSCCSFDTSHHITVTELSSQMPVHSSMIIKQTTRNVISLF